MARWEVASFMKAVLEVMLAGQEFVVQCWRDFYEDSCSLTTVWVLPPDSDEELGYWTHWKVVLWGRSGVVKVCTPGALLSASTVRGLFRDLVSPFGLPHH